MAFKIIHESTLRWGDQAGTAKSSHQVKIKLRKRFLN